LRITPRISAQVVAATRRRPGTHNARRRAFESILFRHLLDQATPESERPDTSHSSEPLTAEELGRSLRRDPAVVEALDRMWPLLTPEQLLHDLFGARALVDLAARDTLTAEERSLLWRDRGEPNAAIPWTEADIALLDEALSVLGPRTRRRDADSEASLRAFGHVVVDEAQDLSPMQLRMVGRRSLSGSMTVVGDIAQATGNWAPASWAQVVEHLPVRRGWRLAELTVNYRTPAEIMDLAGRVLAQVAPGMRPPEAVRVSGQMPRTVPVPVGAGLPEEGLVAAAVSALEQEIDSLDRERGVGAGTIGVLAPPSVIDALGDAFESVGIQTGRVGRGALDERVSLLSVDDAKGLEFDAVTVVEPDRIARESPQGLRSLYVALTRATQRLTVVHSGALPAALAAAQPSSA
jgi:DNA helicase IV